MKGKETKHLKAFRDSKLKPAEKILGHLDGWIGEMMGKGDKTQHNGQFALTNLRACFYRKGILGEVFETIPLSKITSVETLSRMGYRVLRLHTSHDELAFKTFEAKDLFETVYDALESVRVGEQLPPPPNDASHEVVTAALVRDDHECPFCAELILRKAKVCKHCGRDVGTHATASPPPAPVDAAAETAPSSPEVVMVTCTCGAKMKAKSRLVGKTVRCLKCKQPLEVLPSA